MKVVRLETLRPAAHPNLLLLRVHTDEGIVGLGETFFGAQAVEACLHESVAPALLGRDPLTITAHERSLTGYLGYQGAGAETRANSAVNIALWDVLGKAVGQPVHQLLGGAVRADIGVYNTCAGYAYVQNQPTQSVTNWGLPTDDGGGPYEDLQAFLTRPGQLAQSLLDEGVRCMKIWPFDVHAEHSGGNVIGTRELHDGLRLVEEIRTTVGADMDIMIELHGLWNLPAARRIVQALEEFAPYWVEDPIRPDSVRALAELAASTSVPIAVGETVAGYRAYRELLDAGAADVAIVDVGWVGGLSEATRIAALADANQTPVAAHDCTGPVALTVATHFAVSQPNVAIQEMVRAYYAGWYGTILEDLPPVHHGRISAPTGPGLGVELHGDFHRRPDVAVRVSDLASPAPVAPGRTGRTDPAHAPAAQPDPVGSPRD